MKRYECYYKHHGELALVTVRADSFADAETAFNKWAITHAIEGGLVGLMNVKDETR